MRQPIAVRYRNPLNIRPLGGGQTWQGQTGVADTASGAFCVFASWAHGWRAAFRLLRNYRDLHGLKTLHAILHRWAPESDPHGGNHTAAYIARVERLAGIEDAHAPLDLDDWLTLHRLGDAMFRVEAGWADHEELPYTLAEQLQGMELAGIEVPDELQGEVETSPTREPVGAVEAAGLTVAAASAALSEAAGQVEPLIGYADTAKWLFLGLTVGAIGLTAWQRLRRR